MVTPPSAIAAWLRVGECAAEAIRTEAGVAWRVPPQDSGRRRLAGAEPDLALNNTLLNENYMGAQALLNWARRYSV